MKNSNNKKPFNQKFFNDIAQEFDTHVRQSIPLFDEAIKECQKFIIKVNSLGVFNNIIDICGSTGFFGHNLIKQGFKGTYHNIDGSPQMIEIAKGLAKEYPNQMFNHLNGYKASWTDDSGIEIKEKSLSSIKNIDLVLEILGFQFFTSEREQYIKDIAENSKSAIFLEKFQTNMFKENEHLKDTLHKSKAFSQSEIESKKENVLIPMGDYLFDICDFTFILAKYFKTVKLFYKAGNFAGFFCTNLEGVNYYSFNLELTENKFNAIKK